ncbi:zinc finger protein PLAGL1-like isoform X1 [Belonocnema kinseyi]|uniref:zinc finger protein PLAGL1-like isoform X1 n=1 Tax=Belonocnema kinseyi TaxID=2817044 RepID=UPI00143D3C04|nr:zinc finger protein PLAGL1-like isoform X1 [Belonocnema kinseyi]
MEDVQIKSEPEESTGRDDDWSDFCITTHISSDNNSSANTLIEYENDDNLEIKEEVIEGKSNRDLMKIEVRSRGGYQVYPSKNQWEDHNLLPRSDEKDSTCSVQYFRDETLEIKEEIIEDNESLSDRDVKPEAKRKPKIQEPNVESKKKYQCGKCSRIYVQKKDLNSHLKYECNVTPQFKCQFCGKLFKRKHHMNRHVGHLHLHQKYLKASQTNPKCD